MAGICKDYASDHGSVPVLHDVSLSVKEGDYIAIMGPSGSGKTTLMNLLGFLDTPTSGKYLFGGNEYSNATDDELAEIRNRHIGFVFQSFYLLPRLTALENVALPLLYADIPQKERLERAAEALRMVGLGDRMNFYSNQLSGGQCQRVAIARAIINNPELLLADEPTGALDTASGRQIMDIFQQLNDNGMSIIMITHEQSVADCADRIFHILDGRITDCKEIFSNDDFERRLESEDSDSSTTLCEDESDEQFEGKENAESVGTDTTSDGFGGADN